MSKLSQFVRRSEKLKKIIEELPQNFAALNARQAALSERLEDLSAQLKALPAAAEADKARREQLGALRLGLETAKQSAHLLASARPPQGRIKAVFLIHHIEAWDSLADIFALMRAAEDFEPVAVSIRRRFPGDEAFGFEERIDQKLTELGVPHLRFSMENSYEGLDILKALAPDIIFKQSQWDADVPPAFAAAELRFARLCYVPYAVTALADTRHLYKTHDPATDSPLHRAAWKLFYATEDQKSRFEKYAVRQGDNLEIVGHPKVRRLLREGAARPRWPIKEGLPRRFRIIWSPHHSIDAHWLKFGLFPAVYKDMLAWAREESGAEIVLHPHPATLARVMEGKDGVSREECEAFLREWDSLPNAARFAGGDYAAIIAASDCIITDGMSMLIEPQFFNKPVIWLERADHLPLSEAGERIIKGVHSVRAVAEARELARQFAAGRVDSKAAAQRDNTAWLAGDKLAGEGAAERIVASIRRGLRQ